MGDFAGSLLWCLEILFLFFMAQNSYAQVRSEHGMKTAVFLSPEFMLEPGLVSNKYYYGIDFPRGHIAIKSFDAEVVDDKGNSVPLHETYLHHWVVLRYMQRNGVDISKHHNGSGFLQSDHVIMKNSGICGNSLMQYFGLGAETRKTSTDVPDPYGIEVGNPEDIPAGFEEQWMLNVHAIDTRGAEDKLGCSECTCDIYNTTADGYVLPPNYIGGFRCCDDDARCRVKKEFQGEKRKLFLKYIIKYHDWDSSIFVPVKIYILDVTDVWTKADESRGLKARHNCLIEYNVESCPIGMTSHDACTDTKTVDVYLPNGGDVIYGVGHLHAGGTGSALYGEDGRVICSSYPTYGTGDEPGNEAGYIVGMSTCYPSPGSVNIFNGEKLTFVSNYSSAQRHTGVMGLFYLLVSDSSPKPNVTAGSSTFTSSFGWSAAVFAAALIVVAVFVLRGKSGGGDGYEAIIA